MSFRIEYLESVAKNDLPSLTLPVKHRIREAIESKLQTNPVEMGKPLRYSLKGARRLRVGDWRVVCRIEPPNVVVVVKIGHRRDVYPKAKGR